MCLQRPPVFRQLPVVVTYFAAVSHQMASTMLGDGLVSMCRGNAEALAKYGPYRVVVHFGWEEAGDSVGRESALWPSL
jgi:hypothetical protein